MIIEDLKRLPFNEQSHLADKFEAELFRASLYLTAKHLLGYKDVNLRTHGKMIDALESQSPRKLVVMPRGTFKSSLGSVAYPIWLLLKNPNLRILLDGELYTNSKNFLREIKLHLMSNKLTSLFGEFKTDTVWNEGEIVIRQRTRVVKEASITAGGIGSVKVGQHYDVIVCDDLNSPNNSSTSEGLDRVIQHYRYNTSILEPDGIMALIGTRYHENDAIAFAIKTEIMTDNESNEKSKPIVYLVVGVPGSGKSWVCSQLKDKFLVIEHDNYIDAAPNAYVSAIIKAASETYKPLLIEAPFSVSQTTEPLRAAGLQVVGVYIIEDDAVVISRYDSRPLPRGVERKPIPRGHLTRMQTYLQRAKEQKAFYGTSEEVLKHLKKV